MLVRRRAGLLCRWDAGGFFVGLPAPGRWMSISPGVLDLLREATDWIDADELAKRVGGEDAEEARETVEKLLDAGVMVADGNDALHETWNRWGVTAQRFHIDSRDADYVVYLTGEETADEMLAEGEPAASFKEYPDSLRVFLPRRPLPLRTPVEDVFVRRRTHRAFAEDSITLDALATVLFYSFAPLRFMDAGELGVLQARVSPSGGARHEVECYVAAFAVDGLPGGLYHYAPQRHCLELLDPTVDRDRIADLAYGQEPSFLGAFTCLTTAVAGRLSWKYPHPRAYRTWMHDAGHYGQTFALTCTALGLGPFQTLVFHDTQVEELLGCDPDEEFAVYLLSAGVPAHGSDNLPADFVDPLPAQIKTAHARAAFLNCGPP